MKLSIKIKELPELERPYEKLEIYGEKNLSNAELLAIIIKTGSKSESSIQIAQKVLKLNKTEEENLDFLKNLTIEELMQINGIGRVKAIQIKAATEIGIRMFKKIDFRKIVIKTPNDVANILMSELKFQKNEIVKSIILNNKNEILQIEDVSIGGTNFANVEIKDILCNPLKMKATKIILVHNHPSGDSTPSRQDVIFTQRLYDVTKIMGLELLDHIVIGNMNYTSIFSQGVIERG